MPDAVETPRPINLSDVEHEPADEHETESKPNCQDKIADRFEDAERKGRTINPLSEVLALYCRFTHTLGLLKSITLDIIARLLDNAAFVCIHVVGRFLKISQNCVG